MTEHKYKFLGMKKCAKEHKILLVVTRSLEMLRILYQLGLQGTCRHPEALGDVEDTQVNAF